MPEIDATEVDKSLMGLDFPASKEEIVQHARELDISADTMNFLELIPAGYYDTPAELKEMIDDSEEDGDIA